MDKSHHSFGLQNIPPPMTHGRLVFDKEGTSMAEWHGMVRTVAQISYGGVGYLSDHGIS